MTNIKLTADFLSRTPDTSVISSCKSFNDFMNAISIMAENGSSSAFRNNTDFYNSAINMFAEFYFKYFEELYDFTVQQNIDVSDKYNEYTQIIHGKCDSSKVICKAIYREDEDVITMNNAHLANLYNYAISNGVVNGKDNSIIYFSTTDSVHESVKADMPSCNMFKFVLKNDIENNTSDADFWQKFAESIKDSITRTDKVNAITLRDYQKEAVQAMMNNRNGRIILPTGTGKSVIMSQYVIKYIEDNRSSPIIVIMAPRIILTYYLMANIFKQAIGNGITNIEFANVSSGNAKDDAKEMRESLIEYGATQIFDILSTTSSDELRKKYEEAKSRKNPLVIVSTYHSCEVIDRAFNDIDVIICDEAHNLVIGDAPQEAKERAKQMIAKNKFFFTATQRTTSSPDGQGMNNEDVFGKMIFNKSYKLMMDNMEIVPIQLSTIDIVNQITQGNNPIDNERDATVKIESICTCFHVHGKDIKNASIKPDLIEPKMLVTVNDSATLSAIVKSTQFAQLQASGTDIYAISTNTSFIKNGVTYNGSNFKELFMKEMRKLGDSNKPAIILHVDMLSEGLDVPGITGVMFFDELNLVKMFQLFGRAMRLHPIDREGIYSGTITKHSQMIKPMAQVIIPMYMANSQDIKAATFRNAQKILDEYDYIPEQIATTTNTIGDIQNLNNSSFKSMQLAYSKLDFEHDIILDGLKRLTNTKDIQAIFND